MSSIVRTSSLLVVLAIASLSTACAKDDACSRLADSVAKSSGADSDAVQTWMKAELTGPDGKAMADDERQAACGMILGDEQVLGAYQEAAKGALSKK